MSKETNRGAAMMILIIVALSYGLYDAIAGGFLYNFYLNLQYDLLEGYYPITTFLFTVVSPIGVALILGFLIGLITKK